RASVKKKPVGVFALLLVTTVGVAACSRDNRGAQGPAAAFEGNGLRVEVSMPSGPVREGENELRLRVRDAQGAPVDDAKVSVQYSMSMPGMAPMGGRADAKPMGDGEYRAEDKIEMARHWEGASGGAGRPPGRWGWASTEPKPRSRWPAPGRLRSPPSGFRGGAPRPRV